MSQHPSSPVQPLLPRDTRGPTPLSQCAPITGLAARGRDLDRMSRRIIPLLPEPLAGHVRYAGLRNDRIVLLVESPVWASRARMDAPRVLAAVRKLGVAATSVSAKVLRASTAADAPVVVSRPAPHTAQSIRAAAPTIADPELRALLLELADLSADQPRT